jgi:putative salt-induced outer membrane protein YdiY
MCRFDRLTIPCLVIALVVAGAQLARTDDTTPPPAPPPTTLTADLGYVNTAGNSRVQNLTANDKLEHHHGGWLFSQEGAAVWGTSDGVEDAGRYGVALRAEYDRTKRAGGYALASWRRNTFAGISRQFDEGLGAVFHVLVPNPEELDLEIGGGVAQRRAATGVNDDFATGRLAGLYRHYFVEKAFVEGKGAYLANFKNSKDYEYDLNAALDAPFANRLAVKLNYNYHYRNLPPVGFGHWDSTFSAGIQWTW